MNNHKPVFQTFEAFSGERHLVNTTSIERISIEDTGKPDYCVVVLYLKTGYSFGFFAGTEQACREEYERTKVSIS